MVELENKETEYLLQLMACAIKGIPASAPKYSIDMDKLFKTAKAQQIYCIVLPCLSQLNLLNEQQSKIWRDYSLNELQKTIVVNSERENICRQLDEMQIKYMFLKGLEIREYYPKSSMRQMSDNDILYDEARRDDLMKIMKKSGYYLGAAAGISDDFYKKPYATFEFHRTLFSPKEDFCPDFNPWLNSQRVGETSRYKISREDNYIYTLCHMYKHYHCIEGCGVRFICDLYLLTHSGDKLDFNYINGTLDDFGIADFNKTALGLADVLFEDKKPNNAEKELLNFMLKGSVYGSTQHTVQDEIDKHGGKLRFLMHRLFPPKKEMKGAYKILEKMPFLLPVYYIIRLFEKAHHNKKYMLRDLEAMKNYNKKQ